MPLFPDFHRAYPSSPPAEPGPCTAWIALRGRAILARATDSAAELPRGGAPIPQGEGVSAPIPLGSYQGCDYVLTEIFEDIPVPEPWREFELRGLYDLLPEAEWLICGYAVQVAHWIRTSRFCPVCGGEMGPLGLEWRRSCTVCRHERYPPVSPAVLALIHDGDRVLLAHKPGWGERRSILAGFTLPGESLEECVHREVLEESGVRVADLAYFGSQPWPFPHQLMIGFFARYVSGEIEIDAEELEGAEWHDYRNLPPLPPPLSLSRQMIDAWAQKRRIKKR